MSKEALPDHLLTDAARRARQSDRFRSEYGFGYEDLCCLIAILARWRDGQQTTTRGEIRQLLVEEECFADVPGFRPLERLRLVQKVSQYSHQGRWRPSPLALQKFGWLWREQEQQGNAAE